jgi:8-oxo-dGTP pyrophosphatase MutT (NUDIX family)
MAKIVSKTVSVYPFKIEAGRAWYLLLRRAPDRRLAGAWQVVHGHVDADETCAQAAARELAEETSLDMHSIWSADYVERVFDAEKDEIRLVPCFAAYVSGDVKLSDEHDASRWLSHREATALFTFESQRTALEIVHRGFGGVVAHGRDPNPFLRVV